MKKKILITLFIVVIACLLSVAVSAANEVTLVDGDKADLTTVFKVNSNNQITGFNDGYTKDSVTDVIFPDEIEGLEANNLFNKAANLNTITFAATDEFFISGDGIFSGCSVQKITFNPDCVVEIRKGNFSSCTSLTEITFPKFKKLAGSAFKGCSNMVATNELIFAEGMTDIGGHAFNGCTSLSGTVYFPSTLLTIQEYSFQNTGFSYFDLSKCSSLTAVGGGYGGPFTNNDKITKIDLSACVSLTSLKGSFAENCDNLVEVILPPNLETIPSKAFAHCYKLQSIVLPSSVTYIEDEAFHSARRNQEIKTFTVFIQSNVQFGTTYYPFRDSSAKIEFVLIGDNVTVESFQTANTYSAITGATVVDYLDPNSPWTYQTGTAIASHTIVKNYCKSLAITGNHAYNENPCVVRCADCGLMTVKDNPEHTEVIASITYENGYSSVGVKIIECTNEGCTHSETLDAAPLFTCLGYSAKIGGTKITVGYSIDKDSIELYEQLSEKTLKYGVVAYVPNATDNDADNTPINNDLTLKNPERTIFAEVESNTYAGFNFILNGFDEESYGLELIMSAFVYDGEKVYYLGANGQSEVGEIITFNDKIIEE